LGFRLAVCVVGLGLAGCASDLDVLVPRPETRATVPEQHTTGELVHYGIDTPRGGADLDWLARSLDVVDTGPFDGTMLDVGVGPLDGEPIDPGRFTSEIALLQRRPWRRLTANFQVLQTRQASFFDDDAWARMNANAAAVAQIARDAGLRGLFFDTQQPRGFAYDPAEGRSFAEAEARAKDRGRALMDAILRVYPDITLLVSLAYVAVFIDGCFEARALESLTYALLPSFLDGMTAAARDARAPAKIVDAFLPSYPTKNPAAFRLYYDLVRFDWTAATAHWIPDVVTYRFAFDASTQREGERRWPVTPQLTCDASMAAKLARDLSVGFGINVDHDTGERGPLKESGEGDYRPPDELTRVVDTALRTSDRYVWTWAAGQRFWPIPSGSEPLVPASYVEALRRAHP